MSRWKILVAVVVFALAASGADAQKTLEVNFTGLQVFEAKRVMGDQAESVEVLLPDARSHAHPHYAEIRFACDSKAENCYRTYSIADTEVRFVSSGAGQNGPVTLDSGYGLLIGFQDDLKYGSTKPDPGLTARVFLQGGDLGGHEDEVCKYAFAKIGEAPAPDDFVERSYLAVLRQEIDTTTTLNIELKDPVTGTTTTIPIDSTKPWLYHQGTITPYVTVWIVNDSKPPVTDLDHYLSLRDWVGSGTSDLVPHRHSSCPNAPGGGTSFCPPATQP